MIRKKSENHRTARGNPARFILYKDKGETYGGIVRKAFQLSETLLYCVTLTKSHMTAVLSGIRTYYTANKNRKYDHEVIAGKLYGWYSKRKDSQEITGIAEVRGICDDAQADGRSGV